MSLLPIEPVVGALLDEVRAADAELLGELRLVPMGADEPLVDDVALERLDGVLQGARAGDRRAGGRVIAIARLAAARLADARRDGIDAELLDVAAEHNEALDLVLQLADVAGPGVLLESAEHVGVKARRAAAAGPVVLAEEVLAEERDVVDPI